jgi:Na+/melibiose symporter-like transporter
MKLLQVPPALLKYVLFWMFHTFLTLLVVFFSLRMVKKPELQNDVALLALVLIVLLPLALFLIGRFKKTFKRREGLIWWEDIRGFGLFWIILAVLLFIVLQWI